MSLASSTQTNKSYIRQPVFTQAHKTTTLTLYNLAMLLCSD